MANRTFYTNRDVANNDSLIRMAEKYATEYKGEFEPLVSARDQMLILGNLSIPVARVVLNCMRHDDEVCDSMPAPVGRVSKARNNKEESCSITGPHYAHWSGDARCPGVPWAINRPDYVDFKAVIKFPLAVSKSGSLIHRTEGTGIMRWHPLQHEWGYFKFTPDLYVKLVCKYPSILRNPVLISEEPDYTQMQNAIRPLGRCIRGCF